MEKLTIEFEPFKNDDGKEFLVAATCHDDLSLQDLELDHLLVDVIEKATVRFEAIPLTVENLVTLEKRCHIKISQQTIDK